MSQHTKILPAESLTAYERWELPNHNPPPPPPPPPPAVEEVEEKIEPLTLEQIEQIQKEAYDEGFRLGKEEGFAAGHSEGLQKGEQHIRAAVIRLQQVLDAFADPLEELDTEVEQELTELAVAVARQLVRREIRTDPSQIIAVVREAIGALPANSRKVQLHLHPEDAAIVRENMQLGDREEEAWRIVEDPVLTRGGCRIFTEHSQVDATVEKRLTSVVAQLFGGERAGDKEAAKTAAP